MRRIIPALVLSMLAAAPVVAQQQIGSYMTFLGPADLYSSSGARLTDICAVVQQDRANFHRFGRRDPADEFDRFFHRRDNRARIGANCRVVRARNWIAEGIRRGEPRWVAVRIYGRGDVVTGIDVSEGAG